MMVAEADGPRSVDIGVLEQEIAALEVSLQNARKQVSAATSNAQQESIVKDLQADVGSALNRTDSLAHLHSLLLLSDSALPLGSFAYSCGLESYLGHRPKSTHGSEAFLAFMWRSLASLTSTTLPYVIAGHQEPWKLLDLDNDIDASTTCAVVRRASVKQGIALVALWERSLCKQFLPNSSRVANAARQELDQFCLLMKGSRSLESSSDWFGTGAINGHLAPLFGVLCATLTIPLTDGLHLFLLNHTKTLLSAGVRASVLGPYQAQGILASEDLSRRIWQIVQRHANNAGHLNSPHTAEAQTALSGVEGAAQNVPLLDLWGGRHELLYSRIFNS